MLMRFLSAGCVSCEMLIEYLVSILFESKKTAMPARATSSGNIRSFGNTPGFRVETNTK